MVLDIDICRELRVGDTIAVHGTSYLADAIELAQSIESKELCKWTHTMTVCEKYMNKIYVSEAIEKGIVKTDFQTYLDSGKQLMRLRYKGANTEDYAVEFKELADYYSGRSRYDIIGLPLQGVKLLIKLLDKKANINIKNKKKRFKCVSWSAFNYYEILDDLSFEEYTNFTVVEFIESGSFDLEVIKRN